jgi:hypothetical protein
MSPNTPAGLPVAPNHSDDDLPDPNAGSDSLRMENALAFAAMAIAVVLASSIAVVMFLA